MNKNPSYFEFQDLMRKDGFSNTESGLIYNYLLEEENDLGAEHEFDRVAIRSRFHSYESIDAILDDYMTAQDRRDFERELMELEEEVEEKVREGLECHSILVGYSHTGSLVLDLSRIEDLFWRGWPCLP